MKAFLTADKLDEMLQYNFNKNLATIAMGDNLETIVFKLIRTAEAEGWLEELITKFKEATNNHEALKLIQEAGLGTSTSPTSEREREPVTLSNSAKITILFLAANPRDTDPLELANEERTIRKALNESDLKPYFDLRPVAATRAEDLSSYLIDYKPDIVHFSGHGSKKGELYFVDHLGQSKPVREKVDKGVAKPKSEPIEDSVLAELLRQFKETVKCVVLNACHSEMQAHAIHKHIPCVVGMSKAIRDDSAIAFAEGFYRGLGDRRDVRKAFDMGKAQVGVMVSNDRNIPEALGDCTFDELLGDTKNQ